MPHDNQTPDSIQLAATMTASRISRFGGPEVLETCQLPRPTVRAGQVLVAVQAAGVGPWDALIRSGGSALVREDSLPLTLGSDLAGIVCALGDGVTGLAPGDEVYGVTNGQFIGAYAQFALAESGRLALKPRHLDFVAAAAMPVVAVTAWQMLFDQAQVQPGQTVLVLGGTGNVGRCAVQLARRQGAKVMATTFSGDAADARSLGADSVIDLRRSDLTSSGVQADVVIDTVGGALQAQAWTLIKRGGTFVSAVSVPDATMAEAAGARGVFFYVDVTSARLNAITTLLDEGALSTRVGTVLALHEAREAHEMLDGSRPHAAGKIVLAIHS